MNPWTLGWDIVGGRVDRLRARARRETLRRGERARLAEAFPELPRSPDDPTLLALQEEYADAHRHYVTRVSDAAQPVSLKSAALLAWLVRGGGHSRVVDLGSGFSSYVLRREAARLGTVEHWAVDDDARWLETTRRYVRDQGSSDERIEAWETFRRRRPFPPFDLVFHDLGNMSTRTLCLPEVAERVAPGGLLILDDMHKPEYAPHALHHLREGWTSSSLVTLTHDALGRYAYIARRS